MSLLWRVAVEQSSPVWYHGTNANFNKFAPQSANKSDWNTALGHHFTSDPATASEFGKRVIKARLHMSNPKHYGSEDDLTAEVAGYEHSTGNHYPPNSKPKLDEDDVNRPDEDDGHWTNHLLSSGTTEPHDHDVSDLSYWLDHHPDKPKIVARHWKRLADAGHDGITYGNEHEGQRGHLCAIARPHQIEIL